MAELKLDFSVRDVPEVRAELVQLNAELAKLRAFKAYVHLRLDQAGVPADPEPEANAKHGCRIEGRLNVVLEADADEAGGVFVQRRRWKATVWSAAANVLIGGATTTHEGFNSCLAEHDAKVRAATLEEAATVILASNCVDGPRGTIEGQLAEAIRALKPPPPQVADLCDGQLISDPNTPELDYCRACASTIDEDGLSRNGTPHYAPDVPRG